ncbi:FtsX-like permease family protein [Streptomyces sp. JH002]|uniref:ABC transporter permease n=1 Tax=Streptomyces sp. JH002 TaxID=2763259 RepID=UPI003D804FA4
MNRTLNRWRLGLRIARRDALRAKGRSALVVAMIALPILGVAGADLAVRTNQLSTEESLARQIGTADAEYQVYEAGTPIMQHPTNDDLWSSSWEEDDNARGEEPEAGAEAADFRIEDHLPDGATVLRERTGYADVTTDYGVMWADIQETDPADPLSRGKYTLLSGEWPAGPGEVAATEQFLRDSGLRVGEDVELPEIDRTVRITGSYELPNDLKSTELLALNDTLLPLLPREDGGDDARYLVAVDGGVSWDTVMEANTHGLKVLSRQVHLNPPADSEIPLVQRADYHRWSSGGEAELYAVLGVAIALVVLEICLLAGPAFAVGARRSRRQLGLVGSNGGDQAQLRAIMLSSGVVLGAVAAVAGIILGILAVFLARPFLESMNGARFGAWDFRWAELLGVAAFAVFIGTLAALIPAINASRSSVLESLTGTKGVRRGSRALPIAGTIALIGGTSLALFGGLSMSSIEMVGVGAVIAELGLVALTPLLVGGLGRLARFLPLSGRLAMRDAARNRGRTAPAVAAVLAATAGAVAVATIIASGEADQRAGYIPDLPDGTVALTVWNAGEDQLDPLRAAADKTLPVTDRADLSSAVPALPACGSGARDEWGNNLSDCYIEVVTPPEKICPLWEEDSDHTEEEMRELRQDERCMWNSDGGWGLSNLGSIAVGDATILKVLGIDRPEYRETLENGGALVFDTNRIEDDGTVTLNLYDNWDSEKPTDVAVLPDSRLVEGNGYGVDALITPETAEKAGLATTFAGSYYATSHVPTSAEEQAFRGEIDDLTLAATDWRIENGFKADNSAAMLIIALAATVIALGAAGIATGLAQADSEADLATLAAVGAAPRIRRTLSGLQCGLIAAMGVVLGCLSGLVPAVGLVLANYQDRLSWWKEDLAAGWQVGERPELHLALPWETFGQLIVVVPLIALVFAALLTRSRVTLARRAG